MQRERYPAGSRLRKTGALVFIAANRSLIKSSFVTLRLWHLPGSHTVGGADFGADRAAAVVVNPGEVDRRSYAGKVAVGDRRHEAVPLVQDVSRALAPKQRPQVPAAPRPVPPAKGFLTTWPRFDVASGKGGTELVTDATETETRPIEGVMDVVA